MGVLNKNQILKMIVEDKQILGADQNLLSPASLDFRLSPYLLSLEDDQIIDTKRLDSLSWSEHTIDENSGFVLMPGKLYLGSTIEELVLPPNIAVRADGKSTIGRLGLIVHVTAGWIDPGFRGSVTLEMVATNKIVVYPNLRIGQFTFHSIEDDGSGFLPSYAGRYQDRQKGLPVRPRSGGLF